MINRGRRSPRSSGFCRGTFGAVQFFFYAYFYSWRLFAQKEEKKTQKNNAGFTALSCSFSRSHFFCSFFFFSSRLLTLPSGWIAQISNPKNPAHPSFAGAASAVPKITSGLWNRLTKWGSRCWQPPLKATTRWQKRKQEVTVRLANLKEASMYGMCIVVRLLGHIFLK